MCSHENEFRPAFRLVWIYHGAAMAFKVLFCAFGLINVHNSFSVQSETDNEISNSQPFTVVKGEPFPVRGGIWWGLLVLDNLEGPGDIP